MKFSNKIFLVLVVSILNINLSYASSINNIKVLDENNINFDVSNDVELPVWKINTEIKIMKDVNVSFISKDFEDKNKLILNLSSDLKKNNSYSLITILWPDWNIDFVTWPSLEDKEILNTQKIDINSQWMKRLVIVNPRTIELYFNNIIVEEELEFKLFNELSINEIKLVKDNNIEVNLIDKLDKLSNYILMILSMNDNYWNSISFDEDLYEIVTNNNLINNNLVEEKIVEEKIVKEISKENPKVINDTVEDIALNSPETPDTWPETTVLIMLTFIVNTIFIFRKKFFKN